MENRRPPSSGMQKSNTRQQVQSEISKKKGCFTDGVETNPSFNKSTLGVPAIALLGLQQLTKTYSPSNGEQTDCKQTFTQVTILRYKVEEFI